jgi:hypothetical protein
LAKRNGTLSNQLSHFRLASGFLGVVSEEVVSVGGRRRGSKYVFLSPMDPKYLRPLLKSMIIAKAKDITDTQKLIQ